MNLGNQIDSLLKRHSAVYVKDLGVFSRVHRSATFDPNKNVFLPPISYVEFDHFSTEGYDFLSYLQQVDEIDQPEAEIKLSDAVSRLLDHISQSGEATLDSLGNLVAYGNSFIFKPLDLSGFQYTSMEEDNSFESAVIEPDNSLDTEGEIAKQFAPEDVEVAQSTIVTTEEISVDNQELNDNNIVEQDAVEGESDHLPVTEGTTLEHRSSNSYLYGIVAVLAIVVLGGIFYYSTISKQQSALENRNIIVPPVLDSSYLDVDTTSQLVASDSVNAIAVQDSLAEPLVLETKIVQQSNDDFKFIIVIGTHPTLALANDEALSYNKKGHNTVRVLEPNVAKNKKRVIWDAYPTREKRDSALREVRKHIKADAWGTEIN